MESLETIVRWADRTDKRANPWTYYQQNYEGLTRSELMRTDRALYTQLRRKGKLAQVPNSPRFVPSYDFGEDLLAYVRENYPQTNRGELHRTNKALYNKLYHAGLLDLIPRSRSNFGEDPVAYYQANYPHLSRGQLQMKNPALYNRLHRDGLLENVPLKNQLPAKTD